MWARKVNITAVVAVNSGDSCGGSQQRGQLWKQSAVGTAVVVVSNGDSCGGSQQHSVRWFSHFYVSASLVVTVALCLMWSVCVSEASLPPWAATTLDVLTTPHRTPAVNATSAAVALCLLALQIYRRLYENLFVSVFSSGHMNILHYIVGHTFYLGAVTLLLSQAPGFTTPESHIVFSGIEIQHVIGTVIFLFGFVVQHWSLCLLAGLRKNRGKNLQEKYLMPEGGLFEVVSCPHMLAEVLLYIGLLVILGLGNDWLWVTLWVLSNQVQVALMNHKWYQDTFKNYPKHRHAIFPFVL
ncbi:polyprenol reductase-like isoform X2 [Portunus trituberculatus]|uniref:polyprenol reductase-like isoform X2 n=1 Tax=Portunus trituberculatus TaxID=210409 RepID=UPI001E1CDD20|nr:polyprenol reductase-like isoform X2 [Portunus trituberculatus]